MANPLLMAEIFDNINEGIYILNRKGDYIYCNNAFLKMVGATREEALRLNAFQLIPEGQVSVSVAVTAFTEKKKVSVVNNVLTPRGITTASWPRPPLSSAAAARWSICW